MERRSRKESVITLIVLLIIAAVIVSWLTGLWSCEIGRRDLTEEERLTIADYINSISVLVQRSNKTSLNFFVVLDGLKDISREELDIRLSEIIEESKVTLENCEGLIPPDFFEVSHGYLRLVLETRNQAYENFKPSLFNALQDLDIDISSSHIANSFLYMFMSDEIYKYFQEELKKAGEELGISNLTIIDSSVLQNKGLVERQNVINFISDIKTATHLQERRGVAVISQSIEFDPRVINEQGEYSILASGTEISVTILIENQGNVVESDVNVAMSYIPEGNPKVEKSYSIVSINPSEQKAVTISGFPVYPGKKCQLIVEAGPVPGEVFLANNTATYKFMVER